SRLPVNVSELLAVTLPELLMVILSREMPLPLIVVPLPDIIRVPPDASINEPEPVVAKFPVNDKLTGEKVIPLAAIVRLLKLCVPEPPTFLEAPFKIIVLVFPI